MTEHAESRLPRLTAREADASVRPLFDAFQRERGVVPNLFRVAAHRPEIVRTLRDHMQAVMGPGAVPVLLKELLSVRVSQINGCVY
jgi:alkylhydroperoxidase family enzyme